MSNYVRLFINVSTMIIVCWYLRSLLDAFYVYRQLVELVPT